MGDRDRQELLLTKAMAAYRMGAEAESARHARHAVRLYESTGLLRPFATLAGAQRDELLHNAGAELDGNARLLLDAHPAPYPGSVRLIRLTNREQVLAAQLAHTASRQEIAERLYVSVNTVRKQLAGLYRKLDVSSREEALMRIEQLFLADQPPRSEGR